ncbi:MAG: hypothetical protein JJU02_11630 [Cryomorphaceae bacterium]|nr:hypothetical protein [Cryomorphaceae bacterium]
MYKDHALVLVVDNNYLEYAKQVIACSRLQGHWNEDYVLITHEISDEKCRWFTDRGVHIFKAKSFINKSVKENKADVWPEVVYAKLYLLHPYFARWKKLVYLDTDVIVRKDIRHLLSYENFAAREETMGQKLIYQFIPDLKYLSKSHKDAIHSLPHNLMASSFNVGVMMIPSANNTQSQFDHIVEMAEKMYGLAYFPEQAVFNLFYFGRWKNIPYVYNDFFVHDWFIPRKTPVEAVILHLMGNPKPWQEESPFHEEWKLNYQKANDCFNHPPGGEKPDEKSVKKLDKLSRRFRWVGQLGRTWWKTKRFFNSDK